MSDSVRPSGHQLDPPGVNFPDPSYIGELYEEDDVVYTWTGDRWIVWGGTDGSPGVTKDYVDDNFLNLEGGEIQGRLVIKKGIQVSGKASFIARVGQETGGFVLEGRTVDGEIAKLLQVYHNGGTVPDAVNYNGKVTSPRNIVNKEYVDGHVSRVVEALEARIKSLEARLGDG